MLSNCGAREDSRESLGRQGDQTSQSKGKSTLNIYWPEYLLEGLEAEAEAPILWPPDAKSQPIGKDLDAGKDRGQEEKRAAEDEMVR